MLFAEKNRRRRGLFTENDVVRGEKNVWRLEHILEHLGGAELGEAGYMDAVIGEDGTQGAVALRGGEGDAVHVGIAEAKHQRGEAQVGVG